MKEDEKDRLRHIAGRLNTLIDNLAKDIINTFERGADSEGCFMLGEHYKYLQDIYTDLIFFDDDD